MSGNDTAVARPTWLYLRRGRQPHRKGPQRRRHRLRPRTQQQPPRQRRRREHEDTGSGLALSYSKRLCVILQDLTPKVRLSSKNTATTTSTVYIASSHLKAFSSIPTVTTDPATAPARTREPPTPPTSLNPTATASPASAALPTLTMRPVILWAMAVPLSSAMMPVAATFPTKTRPVPNTPTLSTPSANAPAKLASSPYGVKRNTGFFGNGLPYDIAPYRHGFSGLEIVRFRTPYSVSLHTGYLLDPRRSRLPATYQLHPLEPRQAWLEATCQGLAVFQFSPLCASWGVSRELGQ